MATEISNLTYGRSAAGIAALKTNFEKDVNRALKALKEDDATYKELRSSIKKSWSGADANEYLSLLDQQRQALYNKFKEYKHYICNALDEDLKYFQKTQSTSASQIANKINVKK